MDVEGTARATRQRPATSWSSWHGGADVEAAKRLRRLRSCARSAVPTVCVAATVLAVVVLCNAGAGGSSPNNMSSPSSSWSFFQDPPPSNLTASQLLDGLLTADFGHRSCQSRYEFSSYYANKTNNATSHSRPHHKPSPYLLAKLRTHEAIQRRCGQGTAPYAAAIQQLKSGNGVASTDTEECRYLVSISYDRGLGNRMLATASAFLYAVLTGRTLLVHQYKHDVGALFCEPFPGTTWLLPSPSGWPWPWGGSSSFPLGNLRDDYDGSSSSSLGNLLKHNVISVSGPQGQGNNATWADSEQRPPYVYLHLEGGFDFFDKLFFCDEHQRLLHGAPWLLMKTDSYLVPGLFLLPCFRGELERMFPEKDAAFHHIGRYLFHPVNDVWSAVKGYYGANLAGAGHRVGIQIRVFQKGKAPVQRLLDQVLSCVRREKLLPLPDHDDDQSQITSSSSSSDKDKAVLVTSLSSWYYERIREEYSKVAGGGVHQPSHEGRQKSGDTTHDARALSEMYLLSMCDVLVTTGFSTFGYVAQGIGGIRPWIMPTPDPWNMPTPEKEEAPVDRPCVRASSVEPCFHSPSYYDCKARRDVDLTKVLPYVRRCEDVSWGIKIANGSSSHW
ncbi:hypothetical protein BRADI_3g10230v3 [Brachypodium distachyon]|uniref:Fucosyltransferase n=2 Tax=Brachypodium distachyon TaxID=15368 RepID=I1HZI1_BRADI|nr:hypothetical protein BRADI_3g10230v3 [Brachypodium distachyon]